MTSPFGTTSFFLKGMILNKETYFEYSFLSFTFPQPRPQNGNSLSLGQSFLLDRDHGR